MPQLLHYTCFITKLDAPIWFTNVAQISCLTNSNKTKWYVFYIQVCKPTKTRVLTIVDKHITLEKGMEHEISSPSQKLYWFLLVFNHKNVYDWWMYLDDNHVIQVGYYILKIQYQMVRLLTGD
jgi:hypothetical protein